MVTRWEGYWHHHRQKWYYFHWFLDDLFFYVYGCTRCYSLLQTNAFAQHHFQLVPFKKILSINKFSTQPLCFLLSPLWSICIKRYFSSCKCEKLLLLLLFNMWKMYPRPIAARNGCTIYPLNRRRKRKKEKPTLYKPHGFFGLYSHILTNFSNLLLWHNEVFKI